MSSYYLKNVAVNLSTVRWGCILVLVFTLLVPLTAIADVKRVIGWVEKVSLEDGLIMDAKIDTGAKHSSLNIKDHELFKKKGKPWIRFTLAGSDGRKINVERRIIRYAEVKRKGYRSQVRPVVELSYCLGDITKIVEVNLVDRSKFDYQMLVGRSFLMGNYIVDPSIKYTMEPACSKKSES